MVAMAHLVVTHVMLMVAMAHLVVTHVIGAEQTHLFLSTE